MTKFSAYNPQRLIILQNSFRATFWSTTNRHLKNGRVFPYSQALKFDCCWGKTQLKLQNKALANYNIESLCEYPNRFPSHNSVQHSCLDIQNTVIVLCYQTICGAQSAYPSTLVSVWCYQRLLVTVNDKCLWLYVGWPERDFILFMIPSLDAASLALNRLCVVWWISLSIYDVLPLIDRSIVADILRPRFVYLSSWF